MIDDVWYRRRSVVVWFHADCGWPERETEKLSVIAERMGTPIHDEDRHVHAYPDDAAAAVTGRPCRPTLGAQKRAWFLLKA